jgi:hypothetical protein
MKCFSPSARDKFLLSLAFLAATAGVAKAQIPTSPVRPYIGRGDALELPHPETGHTRPDAARPPIAALIGGGIVGAAPGAGPQFLIRAGIVGAADIPESSSGPGCSLMIAQVLGDGVVGSNGSFNAVNVRFTPLGVACDIEMNDENSFNHSEITFHLLPSRVQHDARIGRRHRISVEIIGLEYGTGQSITRNLSWFARGFLSLLGVQVLNQASTIDRAGASFARLEAIAGLSWVPDRNFTLGLRVGAGVDIGVTGLCSGPEGCHGTSDQDAFIRLVATLLGRFSVFGEASLLNRWDHFSGSREIFQVTGGFEVAFY